MARLRISIAQQRDGVADALDLEALDINTALTVTEINLEDGDAEIWDGQRRLARLSKLGGAGKTFWQVR